jgi:hypothetical protein
VSARCCGLWLWTALLLAGCFAPRYGEGTPCAVGTGDCPEGYMCIAGGCWSRGYGPDLATGPKMPAPDLAMPDLATPDLATPDFATPDLGTHGDGGVVTICATQYVSPAGNDQQSGCTPDTAKRTIYAALDIANRFADGGNGTVLVCVGNYAEQQLQLRSGVTLQGGYDCKHWTRTADYGYPTFDLASQTVIQNLPDWSPTLRVKGGKVDGVIVQGPSSGLCSVAVSVSGDAQITNNQIEGQGTACATGPGSIGLAIEDQSGSALIQNNSIVGGGGHSDASDSAGSIGILVQGAATPHVSANTINGGNGSSASANAAGSIALLITGTGAPGGVTLTVEDNIINGGTGFDAASDSARGILVTGRANVDISSNKIQGGSFNGLMGNAQGTAAIFAHGAGDVTVRRNRIFGGTSYAPRAVDVAGNLSMAVINNMIHSGQGRDQAWPVGIELGDDSAIIRYNTILAREPTVGPAGAIAIHVALTPNLGFGSHLAQAATIEDNILGVSGGSDGFAISADGCAAQGIIASLSNNVTFGAPPFRYSSAVDPKRCAAASFTSDDALAAELTSACTAQTTGACSSFGGARAKGNVSLQASCAGGDSGCLVAPSCAAASGCAGALFSSTWDFDQDGGAESLLGDGWKLTATTPCPVAKSSLDLHSLGGEYAFDNYALSRGTPPSMGAHQYDGACQ